jgi:hypothetical protein
VHQGKIWLCHRLWVWTTRNADQVPTSFDINALHVKARGGGVTSMVPIVLPDTLCGTRS